MAKAVFVKKARKDIEGTDIKAGDSYYWWSFRFGGKHVSKTLPKRSQLTQSGFLSQLYDLQDRIGEFTCSTKDDFDSFKDEILSDIENLKDECQNSLDNMPEQLQSSGSGETLQERIDALDNWYSEIESVECDVDEEDIRQSIVDEVKEEKGEENEEDIDLLVEEKIEEIVSQALEELQNTDSGL